VLLKAANALQPTTNSMAYPQLESSWKDIFGQLSSAAQSITDHRHPWVSKKFLGG